MLGRVSRSTSRTWSQSALAIVACLLTTVPAQALVINNFIPFQEGDPNPNQNLVNAAPPPGDRGFSNLPTNRSGVYLGDHWVLSARHAGPNGGSIDIAGETFPLIPNSVRRLNTGTAGSDLILWRVGVNEQGQSPEDISPQLRDNLRLDEETGKLGLPIASRTPNTSENLTLFGRGRTRVLNSTPQVEDGVVVNQQTFFNSSGGVVSNPAQSSFSGFRVSTPAGVWQWGENQRATNPVTISGGAVTPTIAFSTIFDEDGGPNEAQGASGDSGGPVFRQNNSGDYELVGVLHAINFPEGVTSGNSLLAAFGASTFISDLSNSSYTSQIESLRAETEYSVLGDIDLDGSVEAALVGGAATGDLGILVDNWQRTFETANIQSWIAGDLNQDAIVDLADFALLRAATGGEVSVAQLQTALLAAAVAIPEPTSLALITVGLLASASSRRR